jgi:hypothetical protein
MGRTIVSLRIDPAGGAVTAGTTVQLSLFGATPRGGTDLIPANMAVWASTSPGIAEISRQGRLNAHRPGQVTITARYAGQVATAVLSVEAPNP